MKRIKLKNRLEYIFRKTQKITIKLPITVVVTLSTTIICTLFSMKLGFDNGKEKLPLMMLEAAYTGWTFSFCTFVICACWEHLLAIDRIVNANHKNKFPRGAIGNIIFSIFIMFADVYFILVLYKAEVDNNVSTPEWIAFIGIPIIVAINAINMHCLEKKIEEEKDYIKTCKFL